MKFPRPERSVALLIWVAVQPHLQKYFLFTPDPNPLHIHRRPAPHEGRLAVVTDAGRDAMDAKVLQDERRCSRTAKSCGPDASMPGRQAGGNWVRAATVTAQSPITGEIPKGDG